MDPPLRECLPDQAVSKREPIRLADGIEHRLPRPVNSTGKRGDRQAIQTRDKPDVLPCDFVLAFVSLSHTVRLLYVNLIDASTGKVRLFYIRLNPLKREFIELANQSTWSQAELARRLEVSRANINGIITGDSEPSRLLVKALRMTLIMEGVLAGPGHVKEDGPKYSRGAAEISSSVYDDLISELADLPEEEREELLEHFKGLARLVTNRAKARKYPKS